MKVNKQTEQRQNEESRTKKEGTRGKEEKKNSAHSVYSNEKRLLQMKAHRITLWQMNTPTENLIKQTNRLIDE